MLTIDFHIHTYYSKCSIIDPKRLIRVAMQRGLTALAVTDHNTIKGATITSSLSKKIDRDFMIIIGSEIKTTNGEVIGLWLNEDVSPGKNIYETIDEIHSQGGIVIYPHPYDPLRGLKKITNDLLRQADAIEVVNGRVFLSYFNNKARKIADKLQIPSLGGSDAHSFGEIGRIKNYVNATSDEELFHLIKGKKNCYTNIVIKGNPSSFLVPIKTKFKRMYLSHREILPKNSKGI